MNDSRGRAPQVKSARVSPGGSERNYNRGGKEAQYGFEAGGITYTALTGRPSTSKINRRTK